MGLISEPGRPVVPGFGSGPSRVMEVEVEVEGADAFRHSGPALLRPADLFTSIAPDWARPTYWAGSLGRSFAPASLFCPPKSIRDV